MQEGPRGRGAQPFLIAVFGPGGYTKPVRLPVIQGVIDRRILVNYSVDPDVLARQLPAPFRPQLVDGRAMAGICLIRMQALRPLYMPAFVGMSSENAAHRIAVEWDQDGDRKSGVYIPRRDTDSRLAGLLGGRAFPGVHHLADFVVEETGDAYSVRMRGRDGTTHVEVSGVRTDRFAEGSVFDSLSAASCFYEAGSLGYSDTRTAGRYDGLELRVPRWEAHALDTREVRSSFFDDPTRFPPGSVRFDCALLMRDIAHTWHEREDLLAEQAV